MKQQIIKPIVIIVLLVLLLVNIVQLNVNNNKSKTIEKLNFEIKYAEDNYYTLEDLMMKYVQLYPSYKPESKDLKDKLKFRDPLLVLRFKETDCTSCIDAAVYDLKARFSEEFIRDRTMLLISFSSFNAVEIIKQKYAYQGKILNIKISADNNLVLDRIQNPYFFVINNESMSMPLIYEKILSGNTDKYFSLINSVINK